MGGKKMKREKIRKIKVKKDVRSTHWCTHKGQNI
jgi:hypothetical protein